MNRIRQSLRSGGMGYFLVLLLLCVGVLVNFSILGCSSCDSPTTTASTYSERGPAFFIPIAASPETLNPQNTYASGQKVELNLRSSWLTDGNGAMTWTPPFGATQFAFTDRQPEPGGPPFVFANLTNAEATAGFRVSYQAPEQGIADHFYDQLQVDVNDNSQSAALEHVFPSHDRAVAGPLSPPTSSGQNQQPRLPVATPISPWDILRYTDFEASLTQQTCQDMVAQGKSANTFMLWRVPLADQIVANQAYTLPILQGGTKVPKIVVQTGSPTNIEMPLEVRADATMWANQNLPAAPGELWLALGVKPSATINCPVMNYPSFTVLAQLSFDLTSRPQACKDCVLPAYACYKTGAAQSLLLQGAAQFFKTGPNSTAIGEFSCLGPGETHLADQENWFLEAYTNSLTLKPGDPITIHYWAQNKHTAALTFDFTENSSLSGAGWVVHPGQAGNGWVPDLTKTVTSPITVSTGQLFHLYITGTVPVATAANQYSYAITLTNASALPASWRAVTDLIVTADGLLPTVVPPNPAVGLAGQAPARVSAGQNLTYTLTVKNTGALALTDLVLTDALPANTTYQSCTGGDSCSLAGNTITWNLANLGTGQTHAMKLVVKVNPGASGVITNTPYSVQTGQTASANGAVLTTQLGVQIYLPMLRR